MKLSDLLAYDGDGRAQLLLDRRGRLEHQVHDRKLDLLAVIGVDQVLTLSGLEKKTRKKNKVLNLKIISKKKLVPNNQI